MKRKIILSFILILLVGLISISFAQETKTPYIDFNINFNEGEYNLVPFFYELSPKMGFQNIQGLNVYGIEINEIPVAYILDPIKQEWLKVIENGQYTAEYNLLVDTANENVVSGDYILNNYLKNTGILIYWPEEKTYDAGNNELVQGNLVYDGKEVKEYIGDSAEFPEYNLRFYQGWNIVLQTEKSMMLGFDGQVHNWFNQVSECNLLKIAYMRSSGEWKVVQPEEFDNLPNLLSEDSVSGDVLLLKVENDCSTDLEGFMLRLWQDQGYSDEQIEEGLAVLDVK